MGANVRGYPTRIAKIAEAGVRVGAGIAAGGKVNSWVPYSGGRCHRTTPKRRDGLDPALPVNFIVGGVKNVVVGLFVCAKGPYQCGYDLPGGVLVQGVKREGGVRFVKILVAGSTPVGQTYRTIAYCGRKSASCRGRIGESTVESAPQNYLVSPRGHPGRSMSVPSMRNQPSRSGFSSYNARYCGEMAVLSTVGAAANSRRGGRRHRPRGYRPGVRVAAMAETVTCIRPGGGGLVRRQSAGRCGRRGTQVLPTSSTAAGASAVLPRTRSSRAWRRCRARNPVRAAKG